jgi:hypothetical protein
MYDNRIIKSIKNCKKKCERRRIEKEREVGCPRLMPVILATRGREQEHHSLKPLLGI